MNEGRWEAQIRAEREQRGQRLYLQSLVKGEGSPPPLYILDQSPGIEENLLCKLYKFADGDSAGERDCDLSANKFPAKQQRRFLTGPPTQVPSLQPHLPILTATPRLAHSPSHRQVLRFGSPWPSFCGQGCALHPLSLSRPVLSSGSLGVAQTQPKSQADPEGLRWSKNLIFCRILLIARAAPLVFCVPFI